MKILVLGANGMLGHKLVQVLRPKFDVWATVRCSPSELENPFLFEPDRTIFNFEIRAQNALGNALQSMKPDVVINSVGIVKQKKQSEDVTEMLEINSLLPHRLAKFASDFGFRLITFSTDCVFSGTKGNYSEADTPDALDLYGQSKHWGEVENKNCVTIRTSIIGRELKTKHGLVEWFIGQRNGTVKGYTRAVFSGFPTVVFADIIADIIEAHPSLSGVFHVSSSPINKFDLLFAINSALGLGIELEESDEIVIDRSLDSSNFRRITNFSPDSWDTMIETFALDSAQNYK